MLIHTNTTSDEAQNLNGIKTVRLSGKKYPNLPKRILRESMFSFDQFFFYKGCVKMIILFRRAFVVDKKGYT